MMSARKQAVYWLIALVVFVALVWLLSSILLPFVAGMAVAYFLDPPTDKLEARGLSRTFATSATVVVFFILMISAVLLLMPILHDQIAGFLERLPRYATGLRDSAIPVLVDLGGRLGVDVSTSAGDALKEIAADAVRLSFKLLRQAWSSGLAIFNILSLLVITPIVAFYLLRDFDHMIAALDGWLPRQYAQTIRSLLADIDKVMANFIRGQGTVCLILGCFYALSLTLAGLEFGLIIGLFSGFISFVPFIGVLLGLLLSMLIALTQFLPEGEYARIAVIVMIFVIGQVMEGYVLIPRLLGDRIGLHPVWVMFALLAGGALFGFVGVLIALPAAAAIGVMVRFALAHYLDSRLYRGYDGPGSDGDKT